MATLFRLMVAMMRLSLICLLIPSHSSSWAVPVLFHLIVFRARLVYLYLPFV